MGHDVLEGGCHCGAVRFRVSVSERRALDCNCSICSRKGFLHFIATAAEFELLTPEEALSDYRFGTRTARHLFCSTCGIHPFYVPRSHPDGFDVNVRCLDEVVASGLDRWTIEPFDGRDWESHIDSIR